VPIRECTVIAVEGTHASGKTTLVHALVSYYRERGTHITCVDEPARSSPFMEDIVLRGLGTFDVTAELDTFAAQITTQLRAARHHSVLVADKTPVNVVTYARCLLPPQDAPVVEAMLALCAATAGLYDVVLYVSDTFDPHQPGDALRAKVAGQQAGIDVALRETALEAGITLIDIPRGLATPDRVRWVSEYLAESGVLPH
jgi:nicotinamide riboside kinase